MRSGVVADGEVIKMCGKIKDEAKQVCQLPRLPIRLRGDMNGTTNQWEIGKGKIKSRGFLSVPLSSFFPATVPVLPV